MFTISCKVAQQVCPLTRQLSAIKILWNFYLDLTKMLMIKVFLCRSNLNLLLNLKTLPLVYVLKIVRVLKLQITSGDTLSQTERWHTGEKLRKSGQKWLKNTIDVVLSMLNNRWRKMYPRKSAQMIKNDRKLRQVTFCSHQNNKLQRAQKCNRAIFFSVFRNRLAEPFKDLDQWKTKTYFKNLSFIDKNSNPNKNVLKPKSSCCEKTQNFDLLFSWGNMSQKIMQKS